MPAGLLFKVLDRRIGLIICMILCAGFNVAFPFFKSVAPFLVTLTLQHFFGAAIDVAANSWILDLWGEECNSYMQGLHFSFGMGIALAPTMAAPFVGLEPKNVTISDTFVKIENNNSNNDQIQKVTAKPLGHFQFIFVLVGITSLVTTIIMYTFYIIENRKRRKIISNVIENADQSDVKKELDATIHHQKKIFILVIGFFAVLFHVGVEINSLRFVTEFIHFLNYDVETAAKQSSILSISYALFRFLGIFVARFMATDTMILTHLSMAMLGGIILMFLTHISLIWISIGLFFFGAGCSVIFPSIYALVEERTHLSNFAVGLFTAAGLIPGIIYPSIMPAFMEKYPKVFVYNILVSGVLVITCVIILIKKVPKKNQ